MDKLNDAESVLKNFTMKDRGEFLRAFLVLIRCDEVLESDEYRMALKLGHSLGFEKRFCEEALENLLGNEYISEKPPVFSNQKIASFFVQESKSTLPTLNEAELEWLSKIEKANNIVIREN